MVLEEAKPSSLESAKMVEIELNFKLMFHSLGWNQAKVLLKGLENPLCLLSTVTGS